MKREKDLYVAPRCECIEICSEGILCGSINVTLPDDGIFGSESDRLEGEW